MSDAHLRDLKASYTKEVARLEQEIADNKQKQGERTAKLRGQLNKLLNTSKTHQAKLDKEAATLTSKHADEQAAISKIEGEAEDLAQKAATEKKALQPLRQTYMRKVYLASACKQCASQLRFLGAEPGKLVLASEQELVDDRVDEDDRFEAPVEGVAHETLAREVESLDEKRLQLQQDLMDGVLDHGADQRATLERVNVLRVEQAGRSASNDETTYALKSKSQRLEKMRKAADRYKKNQGDILARLQADSKTLKQKMKELDDVAKRCGCKI